MNLLPPIAAAKAGFSGRRSILRATKQRCFLWVAVFSFAATSPLAQIVYAEDVRDYGAKGDGTTDDTAAIRRAFMESKDGIVSFSRGDYRITETIGVELNRIGRVSINGMGGVGRVIMHGEGPAFRFIGTHQGTASPDSFTEATWQKERMPQLSSLEIIGSHPDADGVEFIGVMQPTLHAVLIREVRNGITLSARNRNLLIDACHIYNCSGIGIFFNQVNLHQAIIQGSHISYCKRGGIKVVNGEVRNFQITGNDIEYNYDDQAEQSADIWFDMQSGTIAEGTIVSNTIQARVSPGGANIRFIGPADSQHPTPMSMWTITGNLIGSQETNLHLVRCRGMTISANHIYSGKQRSMTLEDCENMVIGSNSMDQSHNAERDFQNGVTINGSKGIVINSLVLDECGAGSEERGAAIEVFASQNVTVSNCILLNPKFRGIWAGDSGNVQVLGNQISSRAANAPFVAAIEIATPSSATIVKDNLVAAGKRGSVVAPMNSSVLVKDNLSSQGSSLR